MKTSVQIEGEKALKKLEEAQREVDNIILSSSREARELSDSEFDGTPNGVKYRVQQHEKIREKAQDAVERGEIIQAQEIVLKKIIENSTEI